MTMTSFLRGIFLTSNTPNETIKFYQEVAGLSLEQVGDPETYAYWRLDENNFQIAIHDASKIAGYTHPARRESNLTHLYFKIDSQIEFLQHISMLGIAPYAKDDVVITLEDPDGRKVMFGTA